MSVCVTERCKHMERKDENGSLQSPLLHQIISVQKDDTEAVAEQYKKKRVVASERRKDFFEEVKKQLWLAGPLTSVSLLNFGIQIISVMFVGHLGELPLSGASMATSFTSVTGISVLLGMASALDTFCGQSYGANQQQMLGIHMQRAMLSLMIVSLALAIIWANTTSILIFLGQDPEISEEAGKYAQLMIPSLFAYGLLQCINRFLQTQNIVFPLTFTSGAATLLHLILCWILVFKSGLGSRGAAIANSISYCVNVFMLALYVKFSPSCAKTWTGFSKEALHNIPSFLRLAIPSAAMVCLEMWSFEMVVLLSGLLPNPKLETSVFSICLNTAETFWMISFGFSGAVSTRVSNELGAAHPSAARLAVHVVLVMALIEGTLVGTVMILIRNIWAYAYSNEIEVVEYVAKMLPILAVSHFLDGFQCVLSGAVRGCGWQDIGAIINLGSYYAVGIPSAIVLAFVLCIGGKGLWLGMICALVVQVVSLVIITLRTDWEQEAKKAIDRVHDSMTPESIIS